MKLRCILCPLGCEIEVIIKEGKIEIKGNKCVRGCEYAKREIVNPTRILFTILRVDSDDYRVISVKSKNPIPKDKIKDAIRELSKLKIKSDVKIGDIVTQIYDTDIIVTRV